MKNMKVRLKLITGFLTVALFAAAVGVSGIVGMLQMDKASSTMYDSQTQPLAYISTLTTQLQRMRVGMREYALGVASGNMSQIENARTLIQQIDGVIIENFNLYAPFLTTEEGKKLFNEARSTYEGTYQDFLEQIYKAAMADDLQQCLSIITQAKSDTDIIVNNLDRCMEIRIAAASETNDSTTVLARVLLILIIVILAVALLVAMVTAFYIAGLVSKPLALLTSFMNKAGTTGDITISDSDKANIMQYGSIKDEIGQCISSTANFINHMTAISEELTLLAEGDLTVEVEMLSDADTMGVSLKKTVEGLNKMFSEINVSTQQVSAGSKQIADGSQALAQGSTEQAAAVEQLSSSITEIADKTKTNADMAERAARLAQTIKGSAETGSRQMGEMMTAVKEINDASQNIGKVIKVIDDIAFQTNILALNAAVEAARAGQHGKGFAVVAEEVRNLAAKSAGAAKETGSMIANSIEKAELGSRIAGETASSLSEIVSGINESSVLVGDIAKSSEEQSMGIAQINKGIDQVAQVIQQNSATAEESAAASEEMSGQADMLESLVSQFKLKDGEARRQSLSPAAPPRKQLAMPEKKSYAPPTGEFGKY